jgi:tRNA dimethylallyltransferase
MLTTGVPIAAWRENTAPVLAAGAWAGFALLPPRAPLYATIDARFDAMLAAGALEEARTLAARGLDPALPCMKAHGMPWLGAYLRGEMTLADAAILGRRDTRHYAKRQFTWIGNQMKDWIQVEEVPIERRIAHVLARK